MPDANHPTCGNCAHIARIGRGRKCLRGASDPPNVPGVMVGSKAGAVSIGQYVGKDAEVLRWIRGLKTVKDDQRACHCWIPLLGAGKG